MGISDCKFISFLFSLPIGLMSITSAFACTEFRLQAKDQTVLIARTMEYDIDMYANLRTTPRNQNFTTQANGKPALSWKSKFGYVFFDGFNLDVVTDGMNEAGLSFGALYLPNYTTYQKIPARREKSSLSYIQMGHWILGNFSTVDEVKTALKNVFVYGEAISVAGMNKYVFPLHFSVYDSTGKGLVIEYIDGKLNLHENKIGVLTNSPSYDWHLANLNNYIYLSPTNPKPVSLNGVRFAAVGEGFGMVGLPGDSSPPSRFVKTATLLRTAITPKDATNAVILASHIINNVDIPQGLIQNHLIKDPTTQKEAMETTQWTTFKDLTHKILYFHSYENLQLQSIDLTQIDFSSVGKAKMSVSGAPVIEDSTSRFIQSSQSASKTIFVELTPAEGKNARGTIKLMQIGNTLVISGSVSGMSPGAHGFHIHEHSTCADHHEGFKEAGGHFNPTQVSHGSLTRGHAGDLGNIFVDKQGDAQINVKTQKINLLNDGNVFSILNRTIMIHAQPDDLKTDPAGNSGDRVLCGVIAE